jgi:hypothetical protein
MMTFPARLSHQRSPSVEGGVPSDGSNASGAGLVGEECRIQSAGDQGPEGAAPRGVVAQHAPDEQGRLADGGGDRDCAVVVRVGLRADNRGKKGDEGGHVGLARGVMLYAASQRGELGEGGLAAVEEIREESRQLGLLVGEDGQGTMESVHDHAGICYTLGRVLALVVTQAEFGRVRPSGDATRAASAGPGGRKRSRRGRRQ